MPRIESLSGLPGGQAPLWLFGTLFVLFGFVLSAAGLVMAGNDFAWTGAITTTGRVMLTEQAGNTSLVIYGYKDERGVIYHNTASLPGRKINLEPAYPVVVLYKSANHARSIMELELGCRDNWLPLLVIGPCEVAAGAWFIITALAKT